MNAATIQSNILISRQSPAARTLPHSTKIIAIVFTLVSILIIANLFIANSLATKGKLVSDLKIKSESLKKENISLKSEIAQLGSLSTIEQKARVLGFEKNITNKIYIKDPSFAYNR